MWRAISSHLGYECGDRYCCYKGQGSAETIVPWIIGKGTGQRGDFIFKT